MHTSNPWPVTSGQQPVINGRERNDTLQEMAQKSAVNPYDKK
jgi:hypothetical protein